MTGFMSLSSGSCGNCYYFGNGSHGVLIDAGVSVKQLKRVMQEKGISLDSVGAVLVTHEHLDHIRHLNSFCRKICKPVYAPARLHEALAVHSFTAGNIASYRKVLDENAENDAGGVKVRYFSVPHDTPVCYGYSLELDGKKLVIMTDLGRITDEAADFASKAGAVVIESNYDIDMLMSGPYPYDLKMRICGGRGHLSNDDCAGAVRRFAHAGLKKVFLCHLSEHNNTPERACACTRAALESAFSGTETAIPELHCLPRRRESALFQL